MLTDHHVATGPEFQQELIIGNCHEGVARGGLFVSVYNIRSDDQTLSSPSQRKASLSPNNLFTKRTERVVGSRLWWQKLLRFLFLKRWWEIHTCDNKKKKKTDKGKKSMQFIFSRFPIIIKDRNFNFPPGQIHTSCSQPNLHLLHMTNSKRNSIHRLS